MFLPFESEHVHPAKSVVMFLRSILARGPKSAGAAAEACAKGPLCGSPPFLRSVMQEQYPGKEEGGREGGREVMFVFYSGEGTEECGSSSEGLCQRPPLCSSPPFLRSVMQEQYPGK